MNQEKVRIQRIKLENFKNVNNGEVILENNRKNYKASVLV